MTGATLSGMLAAFAFAFMLVLARCGAAVMLLPGFGEVELPMMLRAGFAAALALLLLPGVAPHGIAAPDSVLHAAGMVAADLFSGLLLGFLARVIVLALGMAGEIVSPMIGLSSVLVSDPDGGGHVQAISRVLGLAAPVLVLASGLYALPLSALAGSYALVPPGALLPVADSTRAVVGAVAGSFALALRLAAPFVVAGLVWQVALGLLSRLVPQVQVYFVALPGQILGGLLLFGLLAGAMIAAWQDTVQAAWSGLPGL